jgi:hypothetical protein
MAGWAVDERWRGIDSSEHARVILENDVVLDGLGIS